MTLTVTREKAPIFRMPVHHVRIDPAYLPFYNLYLRLNELFNVWKFVVQRSGTDTGVMTWHISGVKQEFWEMVVARQVLEVCPRVKISWAKRGHGVVLQFPIHTRDAQEFSLWIALGLIECARPKKQG